MSGTLTLYTNPMSRGRIARWMLEEIGQPYEVVILDYGTTMKGADYLAINPMGKVPALTHGDAIVTETAAICAYLADAFPDAGLAPPPGDPARAPYYRWLLFAAGPLEAAVTNRAMGFTVPPDKQMMAGYGSFEAVMNALEGAVAGDGWLTGDSFSAADLFIGAHLSWGLQFGSIDRRPVFEAFAALATDRPAYRRASELDEAAMPPKE
jgi:glutathione S-transferase